VCACVRAFVCVCACVHVFVCLFFCMCVFVCAHACFVPFLKHLPSPTPSFIHTRLTHVATHTSTHLTLAHISPDVHWDRHNYAHMLTCIVMWRDVWHDVMHGMTWCMAWRDVWHDVMYGMTWCMAWCPSQALADIVGFEIKRDEVTSLRRLLDHDIASHLEKVSEVSDQASRCVRVYIYVNIVSDQASGCVCACICVCACVTRERLIKWSLSKLKCNFFTSKLIQKPRPFW
jgi:hypothetical protein